MTETEKKVPELRFKGFVDDWEQREFGEVFSHVQNNTLSRAELNYESGYALNIHYGDILIKFGEYLDVSKYKLPMIANKQIVEKYSASFLQDGDIIIADAAEDETVGKCSEVAEIGNANVLAGLHTIPCRANWTFASGYLGYYMNSSAFHNQLLPLIQGSKISSISKSALKNTDIKYPNGKEEQAKIGKFFKQLDDTIALHQRKLNLLKQLKQTYLRLMFPQNEENSPALRFAGFSDPWEQCKLGELANIIGGGTPSTGIDEYWDGDIDWYSPVEIGNQIFVKGSQKKITEAGLHKSSAKILPVGTVLFTSRAGIGKTAILAKEGATNQGFQSIIPDQSKLDSYFIYSKTHELKQYGETNGAGSTFIEVSGKQMAKMPILIPSLEEQFKIGFFFKQLDNSICLQQGKLDKLLELKQILLGKMFL